MTARMPTIGSSMLVSNRWVASKRGCRATGRSASPVVITSATTRPPRPARPRAAATVPSACRPARGVDPRSGVTARGGESGHGPRIVRRGAGLLSGRRATSHSRHPRADEVYAGDRPRRAGRRARGPYPWPDDGHAHCRPRPSAAAAAVLVPRPDVDLEDDAPAARRCATRYGSTSSRSSSRAGCGLLCSRRGGAHRGLGAVLNIAFAVGCVALLLLWLWWRWPVGPSRSALGLAKRDPSLAAFAAAFALFTVAVHRPVFSKVFLVAPLMIRRSRSTRRRTWTTRRASCSRRSLARAGHRRRLIAWRRSCARAASSRSRRARPRVRAEAEHNFAGSSRRRRPSGPAIARETARRARAPDLAAVVAARRRARVPPATRRRPQVRARRGRDPRHVPHAGARGLCAR